MIPPSPAKNSVVGWEKSTSAGPALKWGLYRLPWGGETRWRLRAFSAPFLYPGWLVARAALPKRAREGIWLFFFCGNTREPSGLII